MRFGTRIGGVYLSGGIFFWMIVGPVIAAGAVVVVIFKMLGWALTETARQLDQTNQSAGIRQRTRPQDVKLERFV